MVQRTGPTSQIYRVCRNVFQGNRSRTNFLNNETCRGGTIVIHTYPAAGYYAAVVTATNSVDLATAGTLATIVEYHNVYLPLLLREGP